MTKSSVVALTLVAMTVGSCSAFTPAPNQALSTTLGATAVGKRVQSQGESLPYFLDVTDKVQDNIATAVIKSVEIEAPARQPASPAPAKKSPAKMKPKKPATHQSGVLSPAVELAKLALGDKELNKLRGKVISMHSDVIGSFVDTADTPFGQAVLRKLFDLSDRDGNGAIDKEELKAAFDALGFSWLKEKQVEGILKRADSDDNGLIDQQEWFAEAPKTLRTNLVKLAKKNGGELGLLV